MLPLSPHLNPSPISDGCAMQESKLAALSDIACTHAVCCSNLPPGCVSQKGLIPVQGHMYKDVHQNFFFLYGRGELETTWRSITREQ